MASKDKLSHREQARVDTVESINRSLKQNGLAIGYLRDQRAELLRAKTRLGRTAKPEADSTAEDATKPLPFRRTNLKEDSA